MNHRGLLTSRRSYAAARVAFVGYAIALFTATHWPALRLPVGGPPRTDLYVHLTVFTGWSLLLIAAAPFGPRLSNRNIRFCVVAGLIYAAIDEATQAVPALNRFASFDDYAANALGILVGAGLALVLRRPARRITGTTAKP